ncbi:Beta-lactamase [Pseudonocardia sp. Ae168_Ps1]|uniref:serine hydrolase n=1 Tax=unclassified Pseudonocardia TaxID=2619320 RepID=UPI0009660B4E|nr:MULTISPECIES: serine hydrolase [unclassified Pseudonocardia]OLL75528.1 Beta-lactamase [Pseudonocardia sp. Ae150A_Ps1]OLL81523.1 Beta-lactamase [Pseudonocardia sp. Ae168_Ps1]OLL84364.1 Beta-lactamase [Pseudonocardia sp. Ae263_Ps1]
MRALNPVFGSSTTAADATALLARLWRGELASDAGTAFARQVLSAQIWPHRLRAGFPATAAVAGKTGTVGAVRNEVGVVTYPGEHPVAVAVFTHAARSDAAVPRADAAIGAAARTAVNAVRAPAL